MHVVPSLTAVSEPGRRRIPEATVARLPGLPADPLRARRRPRRPASRPSGWPSWPASTPPRSARTSPTSAPTAPGASATTSSTSLFQMSRELGLTHDWPVVIVGAGNLGQALANYGGFGERGFPVAASSTSTRPRSAPTIGGVAVRHIDDLPELVGRARHRHRRHRHARPARPRTSPTGSSRAGVTAILNFAPAVLTVPRGVARPQGRPGRRAADPQLLPAAPARPVSPCRAVTVGDDAAQCLTAVARVQLPAPPRLAPPSRR